MLLTSILCVGHFLLTPPDTVSSITSHHALYLGIHSAEYGGGGHYVGLAYERLLSPRISVRVGIGGISKNQSTYDYILNPNTGDYDKVVASQGRYNSALITSQLRYFMWPGRQPGAGLFAGVGLQLVAEEFSQDRNSPYGYISGHPASCSAINSRRLPAPEKTVGLLSGSFRAGLHPSGCTTQLAST